MPLALPPRLWDHRAHYLVVRLVPLLLEGWPLHGTAGAARFCSCWATHHQRNIPAALRCPRGTHKICVNGQRLKSHLIWSTRGASSFLNFLQSYHFFSLLANVSVHRLRQPPLPLLETNYNPEQDGEQRARRVRQIPGAGCGWGGVLASSNKARPFHLIKVDPPLHTLSL
ncbi:hypothetical protein E2C01_020237 [Portunus trituberculatus]|uniref:Uncharacterized protein n=1 Tax=Portunus trituberculatus TaxID=210409 RepID=A0A5B7E1H6_PORTR|nr:hypothetical protein [Portunus trituberculatus]